MYLLKRLVLIFFLLKSYSEVNAQGIVRGKITDDAGEPLIGVPVVLKSNRAIGSVTDFDGNYSLQVAANVSQTLVVAYISYKTIEHEVILKDNEVLIKNFVLSPTVSEINEVEISAKAVRSNDYYMEKIRMNSAVTLNYISSETMKKTGDANVVNAVSRVSGVSTNSGFITVRGIGDRYIKTSINGLMIPTLDPFLNNIRLDMFPSTLVDNIVITKTFSPELPGDWSGAYLSVETKDFPDQLTINAETSVGFNSKVSFRSMLATQTSSTDWLGFDNGFRNRDHDNFIPVNIAPTAYQEFVALGLGPYYQSLGITGWIEGSDAGNAYFRLGLIQLGLLSPALFNDAVAVNAAKNSYESGNYKTSAFYLINEKAVASSQSFPNNWNTFLKQAPLDFSQSITIGNRLNVLKRPLGFLFGFRYGSSVTNDPEGVANIASVDVDGNKGVKSTMQQHLSNTVNAWSALINLSYKINQNNAITFTAMPNISGSNKVRNTADAGTSQTYDLILTQSQFYEERMQLVYQLRSDHYVPFIKAKVNLSASYTDGKSSAPDFKQLTYFGINGEYLIDTKESDTHRYYRYLDENVLDTRMDIEMSVFTKPGLTRKIKFGGGFLYNDRESEQFDYKVIYNGGNLQVADHDFLSFFDQSTFGISTDASGITTIDKYYAESGNPANHTIGWRRVGAIYFMTDYALGKKIRLTGGLRAEQAQMFTDVFQYDSLKLVKNDPRRQFSGEVFLINPGYLDEISFLPAIAAIYKVNSDAEHPVNIRLNYSKTVARPGLRELSDAFIFDYELRDFVFGNSELKMVKIDNLDLRSEAYFKNGDFASASLFSKFFRDHIELVNTSQGFTWQNVHESQVYGIEMEGSKKVGKLELAANVTLVDSKTTFVRYSLLIDNPGRIYEPVDTISRVMYGQAPYVINFMTTWSFKKGITASVTYNLQGKKLVITSTDKGIPDIYEMPRNVIDARLSKELGKHLTATLRIRDLLNTPVRRTYIYKDGSKLDYDKYSFGTGFLFSISCKL